MADIRIVYNEKLNGWTVVRWPTFRISDVFKTRAEARAWLGRIRQVQVMSGQELQAAAKRLGLDGKP